MDPNQKDEDVVGGMESPEKIEMDLGSGGHQVKLEARAAGVGSVVELEKLIKDLHVKGDPQGKVMKVELLSKLETDRMETADHARAARRIKWKEEVRMEMLKREEVKLKMASTPLEKVTDWKAKADMSKMSMEWREKFKHERTNFLFHEVFPILYGAMPHVGVVSRSKAVLAFRPVSKDWKDSAEACILPRFAPCATGWRFEYSGVEGSHDIPTCAFLFHSLTKLTRFNLWSEQCYKGKNPFFSRRLAITGGTTDWKINQEFWKEAELLLRRWGSEIWLFIIEFDEGMTFEVMYEQLLKFLRLMPNLRCLAIADRPRRGDNSMLATDMLRDLGKDIYGPLKARIARNPLPELPHLKHLQFRISVLTPLAQAAAAKYSGSLAYLVMHESESGEGEDPRGVLTGRNDLRLPHLLHLGVTSFAPPGFFEFGRSCPSLDKFSIKQLHVKGPEDVFSFFQNLNRLRLISTLRRLSLTIQPTIWGPMLKLSDDQLRGLSLELPQLEALKLDVIHLNLKNIDFLLPCASLKELKLTYQKIKAIMPKDKKVSACSGKGNDRSKDTAGGTTAPPRPLEEIIQFFQYTNRLYESNLWKLFPEMRLVRIGCATSMPMYGAAREGYTTDEWVVKAKMKIYTKEGYQKYGDDLASGN